MKSAEKQTTTRPVRRPNQSRIFHVCVARFCRIFLVFLFPLLLFFYVIVVAVALCFVRQSNHPRTAVVSVTVCVCACVVVVCICTATIKHLLMCLVQEQRSNVSGCAGVRVCVCVGNKFAKAKRKWSVCSALLGARVALTRRTVCGWQFPL